MPYQGSQLSGGVICEKEQCPWNGEGCGRRDVTPRILRAAEVLLPSLDMDKSAWRKPYLC